MSFFACHEKIDVRGNSLPRTEKFIGKFKSDLILFSWSKMSFYQSHLASPTQYEFACLLIYFILFLFKVEFSFFTVKVLFRAVIYEIRSQISYGGRWILHNICNILKKFHIYDVYHYLHNFLHFVSEAVTRRCFIKKCPYWKLGNHKIPENTLWVHISN